MLIVEVVVINFYSA